MIPSPIHKALSTIRNWGVRHLLMGGQACVLHGAAEFSRDIDIAIVPDSTTSADLSAALEELDASVIAVPPFEPDYLERGHAIHFRCLRQDVSGVRIDVMAKMRGVAPFAELWERRTTFHFDGSVDYEVLSLPDLVQSKKTQRDKDWPMIAALVNGSFQSRADAAQPAEIDFWLREMRTVLTLREAVGLFGDAAALIAAVRRPVALALEGAPDVEILRAFMDEELAERTADAAYWAPLKRELEAIRLSRPR